MKYLYQQLIAFMAVILTILVIVGVSFTRFTEQTFLENTFNQLEGYAVSVQHAGMVNVELYEKVLESQEIHFIGIAGNEEIQYPVEFTNKKFDGLDSKDWKNLKSGLVVTKKLEITLQNNNKQDVAITVVPVFKWVSEEENESELQQKFDGALVAYQPISSIKESMTVLTENLLKGFLISSIVAIIISYFFAKFQLNRINRMRKATNQIGNGNFDVHLETKDKDEFDDLAEDFNQMADSLRQFTSEIERQEERRRQFMADAAHEMRTPLTTINGLLEGLAYNAIPENQKQKCIELMQNETKRLIRLVNENLDYEKIRTNQISIMIQKFNGTETLRTLVSQLTAKAEASNDTLTLIGEEDIEVYADYDRFVQILVNIIQNAIQFTEGGSITLSIEKGYLETIIKISDTGIGMDKEELQNIWDRYYKADPSRKNTKYGESGLGLSIVHQLVKLHKGRIEVESEKNVGTTFTITFPDVDLLGSTERVKKDQE